jgi:hypothetical protein
MRRESGGVDISTRQARGLSGAAGQATAMVSL